MEVEFYCKDSREVFLQSESVDLFFTHPPYFVTNKYHYGGDLALQLQNKKDYFAYLDAYIQCIKNMETALKDTGSAIIILKNYEHSFDIIAKIKNETNLIITKSLIWDYSDSVFLQHNQERTGDEFAIMLLLHKRHSVPRYEHLENFVIRTPWDTALESVKEFDELGFVYDCFPEKLTEMILDNYSVPGDTVADIFGGTGTTAAVSLRMGRKAIYNDVSVEQFNIAKKRLSAIID